MDGMGSEESVVCRNVTEHKVASGYTASTTTNIAQVKTLHTGTLKMTRPLFKCIVHSMVPCRSPHGMVAAW